MYSSLLCQTDTHLHDNVQRELEWDPDVEAGDLAVVVSEGVITLTGVVHSFAAKLAAECAVKRVQDVRGVVNNIQVALLTERTDAEIVREAVHALRAHTNVPDEVTVTARNGFLTLDGTVHWTFQKVAPGMAVAKLDGVRGVLNHVEVKPAASGGDVIENRLEVGQPKERCDALRSTCCAGCAKKPAVSLARGGEHENR